MTELDKYVFSKKETYIFYLVVIVVSVVSSVLYFRNVFFSLVVVPFVPKIKQIVIEYLKEKRRREFIVQFKDFLFMMATAIGSGRPMRESLEDTIQNLAGIYGENAVLVDDLRVVHERISIGGENDVTVFYDFANTCKQEDVIDFVTVYSICKVTGANLITALVSAANILMDKITIDREIEELVFRKKKEGMLIFIMPTLVIFFLNLCSPDYIEPLYGCIEGRLIMAIALIGNVFVYSLIQKIARVEI